MSEHFIPKTSDDLAAFECDVCGRCANDNFDENSEPDEQCDILFNALVEGEPGQIIPEWIIGEDGKPTCTELKETD